jgi:hypothetical protein
VAEPAGGGNVRAGMSCLSLKPSRALAAFALTAACIAQPLAAAGGAGGGGAAHVNEAPDGVKVAGGASPAAAQKAPRTLAASARVNLAVKTGGVVRRELFGVAYIASAARARDPQIARQLAALDAPVTSVSIGWFGRVRSGAAGDAAAGGDWREFDTVLAHLRALGLGTRDAPLLFALGGPAKWFDVADAAHRRVWAETIAEAARRCERAGVRVGFWELWNEPDAQFGQGANARYKHLWAFYSEAARALKRVDPTLNAGGPALAWPHGGVLADFLKTCGADIDFVSYHQYSTGNYKTGTRAFLDGMAPRFFNEARGVKERVRRELGGSLGWRDRPVFLTEYNMNYDWNPGEQRQQDATGAAYTAVTLFSAAAGGLERAAIWSAIGNSRFGLVHGDNIAPSGRLLRVLAKWAPGESALAEVSERGTTPPAAPPRVRVFATVSAGAGAKERKKNAPVTDCAVVLVNTDEVSPAVVDLALVANAVANTAVNATANAADGFGGASPVPAFTRCEEFLVGSTAAGGEFREAPPAVRSRVVLPPMSVLVRRYRR